ncbi:MAG: hypothetical protein EXR11_04870 [Rhodospirillaceae bacterium]|nr:hypothetical protein [Rhodospirillaceae bacterium]
MGREPWYKRFAAWRRRQAWWPTKIISERHTDEPYLERISLIKIPGIFQIAIHRFWKSDDDGGLHDHPWLFWGSCILEGGYLEHLPGGKVVQRSPGAFRLRHAWTQHRIVIPNDGSEVWTIFMMGPKIRAWGFIPDTTKKWMHWVPYLEMRAAEGRARVAAKAAEQLKIAEPPQKLAA